jgi:outer membrane biosynthesis protein TonB
VNGWFDPFQKIVHISLKISGPKPLVNLSDVVQDNIGLYKPHLVKLWKKLKPKMPEGASEWVQVLATTGSLIYQTHVHNMSVLAAQKTVADAEAARLAKEIMTNVTQAPEPQEPPKEKQQQQKKEKEEEKEETREDVKDEPSKEEHKEEEKASEEKEPAEEEEEEEKAEEMKFEQPGDNQVVIKGASSVGMDDIGGAATDGESKPDADDDLGIVIPMPIKKSGGRKGRRKSQ